MIQVVAMSRITITVDEDLLGELRERVPPGEVSAYIVESLRNRLRKDPILELIDKLGEMYGPLTDEELAEGTEWLEQTKQQLFSMQEQSSDSPEATAS